MTSFPWISLLTALPLVGALVLLAFGGLGKTFARCAALAFSFAAFALVIFLWLRFDTSSGGMQFQQRLTWIPTLGAEYRVGIDGLGLLMLLLTSIVVPIAIIASCRIQERVPLYYSLVLILQTCLFGAFTALNFFHWFIFWELSLIPAFFPYPAMGWAAPYQRSHTISGLHHGRQRRHVAVISRHLPRNPQI